MTGWACLAWTGRRVLVTGAGGFIGSHLVEALVRQGAAVTALMRYRSTSDTGPFSLLDPSVRQAVRQISGASDRNVDALSELLA